MSRLKAIVIRQNGFRQTLKFRIAEKMLAEGEAILIKKRPLVVRELKDPHYQEELTFLNGRFMNKIEIPNYSKHSKNYGYAKKFRTRPPRRATKAEQEE
jgi:hypothetical protein